MAVPMLRETMTLIVYIVRHHAVGSEPSGAALPCMLYVVDMFHNGMGPEPTNALAGDLHVSPWHGHPDELVPLVDQIITDCCEPIIIRHHQAGRKFPRYGLRKNSLAASQRAAVAEHFQ